MGDVVSRKCRIAALLRLLSLTGFVIWLAAGWQATLASHAEGEAGGLVSLSSGWYFYPGSLYQPGEEAHLLSGEPVSIPHVWSKVSDRGPDGAYGVGTYIHHVKLAGPAEQYALIPGKVRTVYRYYAVVAGADGQQSVYDLGGNGQPGLKAESTAGAPPFMMFLPFEETEFDLILQVSNDYHFQVGLLEAPEIAPAETINKHWDQRVALFMVYTGFLFAIGLYTLLLALWHAGESYYYVGCLILVAIAIRLPVVAGYGWVLLPEASLDLMWRIEYLCFFVVVPLFYALACGLYPEESSKSGLVILLVIMTICCGIGIFAPMPVLVTLRDPYMALAGMAWLMVLFVFARAKMMDREGAGISLIGLAVIAVSMTMDIALHVTRFAALIETVPFAAISFALILVWLFTARYRKEQRERLALSKYLEQANHTLRVRAAELDTAHQKLENAMALKSSFLANVSTEIRTPLNAIIGFSDLMLNQSKGPVDVAKQRKYLNLISLNAKRLFELMDDIVSVSDIESGNFDVRSAETDPKAVLDTAIALVEPTAYQKEIMLDIQCESVRFWADERLMLQSMIKILSNAMKFSPDKGVVSVRGSVMSKEYVFSVADTGPGMSEEELQKALSLFEKVSSDPYMDDKSGIGFGLPLVSRFMNLMGGNIDIDTIPSLGTTVTLRFPMKLAEEEKDPVKHMAAGT